MPLPIWKTCRCTAYLPTDGQVFPEHNYGDAPDWWGNSHCEMSLKPVQRRKSRAAGTWWEKYVVHGEKVIQGGKNRRAPR